MRGTIRHDLDDLRYDVGMPSRPISLVLLVLILCGGGVAASSQTTPAAASPESGPSGESIAAQFEPSLDLLQTTLTMVRVDKWKSPAGMRDATDANLNSIRRDVQTTLPSLMGTADALHHTVAAMLPVSRNVNALYDVLLRVTEQAKTAAPSPQAAALEQAAKGLDSARRAFDERIQAAATAQEQKVKSLQEALNARPAPTVVPTPTPVAPYHAAAPASRPKRKVKPTAKPLPAPASNN